jgi:hypothetical protein
MREQRGQAMVIAVLCLGVLMAALVYFGASQGAHTTEAVDYIAVRQGAYEALAEAAKQVQSIYANQAACDPDSLNTRLSALPNLPYDPSQIGLSSTGATSTPFTYQVIFPYGSSGVQSRYGICGPGSGTGCRQMAIPINGKYFVVTAGAVTADYDSITNSRIGACPRDASIILTTAAMTGAMWGAAGTSPENALFMQRVTLTNVCTIAACDNASPNYGAGFDLPQQTGWSVSGANPVPGQITITGTMTTTTCTGADSNLTSRNYGGGFTTSTSTLLSADDLRWARRYLETGGEGVGETNFLYYNGATVGGSSGNGSCSAANSVSQCLDKPCFPFFDLNRDGKNNEEDLAILENFMRGYLTSLPVNELP